MHRVSTVLREQILGVTFGCYQVNNVKASTYQNYLHYSGVVTFEKIKQQNKGEEDR